MGIQPSLIYTFSIPGNGTIKAMDFGTTENNRILVFRYIAQESKFDSYLPIIERMIDSLRVRSSNTECCNSSTNDYKACICNVKNVMTGFESQFKGLPVIIMLFIEQPPFIILLTCHCFS